jgi:hypothetical protein
MSHREQEAGGCAPAGMSAGTDHVEGAPASNEADAEFTYRYSSDARTIHGVSGFYKGEGKEVTIDIRGRAEQRVPDHLLDDLERGPFGTQQTQVRVARDMERSPFESHIGEQTLPDAQHVARIEPCADGCDKHQCGVGLASSGPGAVRLLRVLPCLTVEALALSAGQREPNLPASIRAQTVIAVTCTALLASCFRRCHSQLPIRAAIPGPVASPVHCVG